MHNLKRRIIKASRNMIAKRVAMMTNTLTLSSFFTITAPIDMTRAPNPEITKLRNGLQKFVNFSFVDRSFLASGETVSPAALELYILQSNYFEKCSDEK